MVSTLDKKLSEINVNSSVKIDWKSLAQELKGVDQKTYDGIVRDLLNKNILVAQNTIGSFTIRTSSQQPLNPNGYAFKQKEDAREYARHVHEDKSGDIYIMTVVEKV